MSLIYYPSYCGTTFITPLEAIASSLRNTGYNSLGVPTVALHNIAFEHPIYGADPYLYYKTIDDRGAFLQALQNREINNLLPTGRGRR